MLLYQLATVDTTTRFTKYQIRLHTFVFGALEISSKTAIVILWSPICYCVLCQYSDNLNFATFGKSNEKCIICWGGYTDDQVFYAKFLYGKIYLRSALCMCNKFSMTSFYVTSFICQVQLCMCNKFAMTSFWLSDRCNSYYYPLQQYRVSQKCPPFRNHSCVLLLLYLWEFTLIYMNFGSIDAVKLLRQILVAL